MDGISVATSWLWNWTTAVNVEVKVTDGGTADDTMQIMSADGLSALPFGTVDLGSKNYITSGAGTFTILGTSASPSTLTRATNGSNPFTVTFGAVNASASTGSLSKTAVTNATVTWTPSFPNPVFDAAGNVLANTTLSVKATGKTQF
jgi:hypothetical protein